MTALAAKLLTFALLLSPGLSEARAGELAAAIDRAAGGRGSDAALLLITNFRESGFRREVEDCRVTGDGGHAVTAYQLHVWHWGGFTRAELCGDAELAGRRALAALGRGTVAARVARYLGRAPDDPEVRLRVALYDRLRAGGGDG